MPGDAIDALEGTSTTPEMVILGLPSDFPSESHATLGIGDLAVLERRLRVAQAHDALQKLRTTLGLKSFLVRERYAGHGYTISTRTTSEIKRAECNVSKWRAIYTNAWNALERLRDGKPIPSKEMLWRKLRPLQNEDCIMLSEWLESQRYWQEQGERQAEIASRQKKGPKPIPWIWKLEYDLDGKPIEGVEGILKGMTQEGTIF
jgi:hypothetical protein